MGAGSGVGALAGFAQLGLGIALLIILTTHLRHAGPSSCVFAAGSKDGLMVCDAVAWLSYLSVGSSLIISVSQGVLSLVLGMPARSVEVLSRLALAVGWTALAVLGTVTTIQSDGADKSPDRTHWRHVGLGLTWALTFLALVMATTAGAGAICGDCPLAALLCCCLPCCCCCSDGALPLHHRVGLCEGGHCCGSCCELTGLACCFYWCFPRSWLPGAAGTTTTTTTVHHYHCAPHGPPGAGGAGGAGYAGGNGGPPPHPNLAVCPPGPPAAGFQRPPTAPPHLHPPAGQAGQAYAPPPVLGPVPTPAYYPAPGGASAQQQQPQASAPPLIAHVYSPFTQGPTPPTLGWGVPMLPPAPPQPQPHAGPAAYYPPVLPPAPEEGAGAGPSAPPRPPPYKEGYEAPTAPPGPYR